MAEQLVSTVSEHKQNFRKLQANIVSKHWAGRAQRKMTKTEKNRRRRLQRQRIADYLDRKALENA